VLSVIFMAAMSASATAPLLAGVIVTTWGSPAAIGVFAAAVAVSALIASLAAGIRDMKPIDEVSAVWPER
jgi:hypothetical protein